MTVTLSYDSGDGPVPVVPPQTITEENVTLIIEWTASSDGNGPVEYLAGWSPDREPDPAGLSSYTDVYSHQETIQALDRSLRELQDRVVSS